MSIRQIILTVLYHAAGFDTTSGVLRSKELEERQGVLENTIDVCWLKGLGLESDLVSNHGKAD